MLIAQTLDFMAQNIYNGYMVRAGADGEPEFIYFATQKRTMKDSAYWYQKIMEENGKMLSINKSAKPILFLNPVFKQMIWGGDRLGKDWPYEIPGDDTGECWAV